MTRMDETAMWTQNSIASILRRDAFASVYQLLN
jgi:hypothetical protein